MKILMVNKFFYPKGGADIVFLNSGKLFENKGHDVNYFSMHHPKNSSYQFSDNFVSNVEYLNEKISFKKKVLSAFNILYSLEAKAKIKWYLENTLPDIVHLHNIYHQLSPSILSPIKKMNIPVVMTLHDYKLVCANYLALSNGKICTRCEGKQFYHCMRQRCVKGSFSRSMLNTIEMYFHHRIKHFYDKIDVFISPSLFLIEMFKNMGFKKKIIHIPNYIEASQFIPEYQPEEKSICYVGRLSKEKGVATLINAFKLLKENNNSKNISDLKLKIIGTGPIEEELKSMLKNDTDIYFLGFKTGDDLKREISNSLFAVIPSEWYENNPLSVLEIFALGKPMIGANIGGIPELVKNQETGLIFKSGNTKDLADKMLFLIENSGLIKDWGKNARNLVENSFNSEVYYNRVLSLYKKLINPVQKTGI